MRIVFEHDGVEVERRVHATASLTPTIADLVGALTPGAPTCGLAIGDRYLAPTEPLLTAGLVEGSVVRLAYRPVPADPDPVAVLAIAAGLDAGRRLSLPPGEHRLGRAGDLELAAPSVSREHCAVAVHPDGAVLVRDTGSRNGTRLSGSWVTDERLLPPERTLEIGALHLRLEEPIADGRAALPDDLARRLAPAPVAPFNRPPRPAPPPDRPPLRVPTPPAAGGAKARFNLVTMLAPLAFGAIAAVVFNPLMAVFALLSPVMMAASTVEARRRGRGDRRRSARAYRAELDRFTDEMATARVAEVAQRRMALPDPAEVARRAMAPSVRLWERRLHHPDALLLRAGTADVAWRPRLDGTPPVPPEVDAVLDEHGRLARSPVPVDLSGGGVVGIVGPRPAALAVARSLACQAAVHHGPADVRIVAATTPASASAWRWLAWLPHHDDLDSALDRDPAIGGPVALTIVDGDDLLAGRASPIRSLLRGQAGPAAGIVCSAAIDRLPAVCTTIIDITDAEGLARLLRPEAGELTEDVLVAGITEATALGVARALARWDDPELPGGATGVPATATLVDVLGLGRPSPAAIAARWRAASATGSIAAPVGADGDGAVLIDLVADGPHALIGGTTGSGKSELLRSLVVSMAATAGPDQLTFVLVDYKGGSAFDACARLPHTVGVVTDLDEHLGERALRCLDAEVRHRERVLRATGATDLLAYAARRMGDAELAPLPRLVVVIDEFATLAAELPDFLAALVSVAQRGRSLGVHLVLATQRPSGAISDSIRTNTNLRIALRVLDRGDSTDVIGAPDAALISRQTPGRAYARLGPGELVAFQVATCAGRTTSVEPTPVVVTPLDGPAEHAAASGSPNDLDQLVDAICTAFDEAAMGPPRRPWPDPLPRSIEAAAVPQGTGIALGLADDPDRQRQVRQAWEPARGNLLVFGAPGSGTTTTLVAAAVAMAATATADELHLYALDHGAGGLAPLAALPHTGAVILATERERQVRLIRILRDELDRRRSGHQGPQILVLVDGIGTLHADLGDASGILHLDAFHRVAIDGPAVGIRMALTADRAGAVPTTIAATCTQRLVLRLADPVDGLGLGLKVRPAGALPPGRGWWVESGLAVQVARPDPDAINLIAQRSVAPTRPPQPVAVLPSHVDAAVLGAAVCTEPGPWHLPVGIGDARLAPVGLRLLPDDHALITGPARSGKSTALAVIGTLAAATGVDVVAVAGRRSPLAAGGPWRLVAADEIARAADQLAATDRPWLLLVDDADDLADGGGHLQALLARHLFTGHVIAAARADRVRTAYGSWIQELRESRVGLAMRPNLDLDGDLWQTPLPRRLSAPLTTGRGFVIGAGDAELVQVAVLPLP